MVWKKDLDEVKNRTKSPDTRGGYAAYRSLADYQRPKDTYDIRKCANCSVYYKSEATLHRNFQKRGDNVAWQQETPKYSCPKCGSRETTYG